MKENLLEELYRMKSLVSYEKGKVISEQPLPPAGEPGQLPMFPFTTQQTYQQTVETPKQTTQAPKTLKWIPEKFPLKYMMQGENVKKLQQALDVKNKAGQPNITGKFYDATQFALDKKIQELGLNYNRNAGLDETTFNDIVNPRKEATKVTSAPVTAEPASKATTPAAVPATVPGTPAVQPIKAPQLQTPVDTPEQYYNKLVGMGLIDSVENGGNRIVYRGPVPAENVQKTLNDYLGSLGYQKTRERNPRNKDKQVVVWKK